MQTAAKTPEEYIQSLPKERGDAIAVIRKVILQNLPLGYVENMNWGMISYEIPLETYPNTYNKKPLMYAALASQKNYVSVYLTNVYMNGELDIWFRDEFQKTGLKLDMGKSCLRLKDLDNLPLELIGKAIARTSVEEYIGTYEEVKK